MRKSSDQDYESLILERKMAEFEVMEKSFAYQAQESLQFFTLGCIYSLELTLFQCI